MKKLNEKENENRTLYCDMDGVLADFIGHYNALFGGDYIHEVPDDILWSNINQYGKAKFFAELPWMEGSKEMWKYIENNFLNVKILSALGKSDLIDKQTSIGKRTWLSKHIPSLSEENIILVQNKHKKRHYSRPGDIIIDDTPLVIHEWRNKGGIAILHKNANDTIQRLEKYVYEKI
jgi:5'(3')-deoxyribonucleotidase